MQTNCKLGTNFSSFCDEKAQFRRVILLIIYTDRLFDDTSVLLEFKKLLLSSVTSIELLQVHELVSLILLTNLNLNFSISKKRHSKTKIIASSTEKVKVLLGLIKCSHLWETSHVILNNQIGTQVYWWQIWITLVVFFREAGKSNFLGGDFFSICKWIYRKPLTMSSSLEL